MEEKPLGGRLDTSLGKEGLKLLSCVAIETALDGMKKNQSS